jgi:conjugal transfer pilus assembly protein TraB
MNLFGMFDKKETSSEIKSKQSFIKIIFFLGILVAITFDVFIFDSKPAKRDVGEFNIYTEEEAVKTRWISEAASDLQEQKKTVSNLEKQMQSMLQENKNLKKELERRMAELEKQKQAPSVLGEAREDGLYGHYPKPVGENDTAPIVDRNNRNTQQKDSENPLENEFPPELTLDGQMQKRVERVPVKNSLKVDIVVSNDSEPEKDTTIKPLNILPTGSILQATLLNGMDAPTMSQAKDNPLIVHMILKDMAILPNRYKYDIRECFVLGEGYGDLASERVYIRTNSLSCVTENGEHIETELNGYIAGEDGKIGLRGEVVSKQGAVIARSIIAGFVDGVAQGFSEVGSTIQITPYGTTQSQGEMDTQRMLEKGAYSGLSEGASRLMDFYLKLADQVYPVIELEAGRTVDIVVTNAKELTTMEEKQNETQASQAQNTGK